MEKLFGYEYVQGYTSALQDVLKTIEKIQPELKYHKQKQNYKTYKAIIECMLKNRAILRENPDAFVRHNADGYYEVYISRQGVYNSETKKEKEN